MKLRHLAPSKNKFTEKRLEEIAQEDCHPTREEIADSYNYVILSKSIGFLCGDVIEIYSKERSYKLYYFVARDGLELIELGEWE